jgi:DNA-binding transcriptional regulator YiaG
MRTPALPFCHVVLKAQKPKDAAYPAQIETLGDQLRAKRLDLGLRQRDVAILLRVNKASVLNWENNRKKPVRRLAGMIRAFLHKYEAADLKDVGCWRRS